MYFDAKFASIYNTLLLAKNMKMLTKHLDDINETYLEHMLHALRFSLTMAFGSVVCLIHAFLPFLFEKTGSNIIRKMHHDMVTHRTSLSSTDSVTGELPESA